jgi:hypothetical protein
MNEEMDIQLMTHWGTPYLRGLPASAAFAARAAGAAATGAAGEDERAADAARLAGGILGMCWGSV